MTKALTASGAARARRLAAARLVKKEALAARRTPHRKAFGVALAKLRNERRLNQEQLAPKMGINKKTLIALEKGKGAVELDVVAGAAKALDCSVAPFLASLLPATPVPELLDALEKEAHGAYLKSKALKLSSPETTKLLTALLSLPPYWTRTLAWQAIGIAHRVNIEGEHADKPWSDQGPPVFRFDDLKANDAAPPSGATRGAARHGNP